jgi:hypothetical protein
MTFQSLAHWKVGTFEKAIHKEPTYKLIIVAYSIGKNWKSLFEKVCSLFPTIPGRLSARLEGQKFNSLNYYW